MTSIIKFTPLCGAHDENPLCYLLEVDEFRILLDCGWNSDFDVSLLKPLARVAPRINLVLISHPDLAHIGALPYAFSKLGLRAPVLATMPIHRMAQMFFYDTLLSRTEREEFSLFSLDDVDDLFEKMIQLKYSQRYIVKESGINLDVIPYAAGHMIGGTVWQIRREGDEIVYAVDYNHKKERHLNPSILETLSQPTFLITDAYNALYTEKSRRERDTLLFESIAKTTRQNGNVLLPVDSAGRVLELLLLLDAHWAHARHTLPLVLYIHSLLFLVPFDI